MREINFRAWHIKEQFMDSAWMIDWEHRMVCHSKHNISDLDDCILMQFTGREDKNGKKVFESDIVKNWAGEIGIIKFHSSWAAFYFSLHIGHNEDRKLTRMIGSRMVYNDWDKYEVIGNIYEQPDILNPPE